MSNKIGHFEILSELSKSATCVVYKVNDAESSQTVALKAIQLSAFGEHAAALQNCLLEEAETTKVLSHPNLTPARSAGEIDGQFCATMEYIQGNSIATMLARKEGFSIWDLLDIGRQVCGGFDNACSQNVFHFSLEPAKIMCGWDGTVRILGYGVSSLGKFTAHMPGVPSILHYMSPEQVRGEAIDARSNLFSLGAMFYEMVTDRKAFDREDAESLRQGILESTPVPPMHVNAKLHPVLSDLIMKALAKDPGERYQSGRELLDDLEKCKESKPQTAKPAAAVAPPKAVTVPDAVKAATQTKFVGASAPSRPAEAKLQPAPPAERQPVEKKTAALASAPGKAAAAAAGWSGGQAVSSTSVKPAPKPASNAPAEPSAYLSSSVLDEPSVGAPEADAPRIAVDPMMAEAGPSRASSVSFSEMTELPPLKEEYIPPPPPPVFEPKPSQSTSTAYDGEVEAEKPKVQPREVAEKAIKEIKNVPPQLLLYSLAGAAVLILIIAVVLVLHVNTLNSDGDTPRPAAAETAPQPAASAPAAPSQPVPSQPAATQPQPEAQPPAPVAEAEPAPTHVAAAAGRGKNARKKAAPEAPLAIPGQMAIDSSPQGAQVQIDGKTDPSWVTPFSLSGLVAGQHTVTVSKAGYSTDTRAVDVASGSKAFVVSHLAQLMATLAVSSTPAGANVYVDGKDTGKLTPAQVSVDKGQHLVLVRKSGYIDATTNAQFILGQTINFSPALPPLGNVDNIKTTGKMKKLFGGKDAQGQGTVSIKTTPKGAQVAVNQHMLDKGSPVDFMLDPGNYLVDITLSGYAPVHKVITVDKGGKAVIDEVLQDE
jgi:eukaryotic-like serine/threonine-protein kinase